MDHPHAVEIHAAERYLLGELSASEAEDFERHYFECAACADDVESAGAFIAGSREVLSTTPRPVPQPVPPQKQKPRRFLGLAARPAFSLATAAALVCAALALYEGAVVIPRLRHSLDSPVLLPAFELAGASRGAVPLIRVSSAAPFLPLSVDVPPDVQTPRYRCVLAKAGQPVFEVTGPAPAGAQPITVLVPVDRISPGKYELIIYGVNGPDNGRIASYPFQLEFH